MTDNMKCPFCGAELQHWGEDFLYCENLGCPMSPQIELPISIWQVLIDSKKAQRQLRTVKDRCVKKVKAKEREIANYLNGINVLNKEIETLHKQLQKAQDALKVATDFIGFVNTSRHADGALAAMAICKLNEITSITKQENEK